MAQFTLNLNGLSLKVDKALKSRDPAYVTRYFFLSEIIRQYRSQQKSGKRLKILDVGGFGGALGKFIDNVDIIILDVFDSDEPNYIKGTALDMPFEDNSFDIVLSSDVFEHITKPDRQKFIEESMRVTRDLMLLCAPFDTKGVADAEDRVNNFYKAITNDQFIWLKEHKEYGLPVFADTKKHFQANAASVAHFKHFSLEVWETLMMMNFFASYAAGVEKPVGRAMDTFNRQYIEQYANTDFNPDGYRQFFVAGKTSQIKLLVPDCDPAIVQQLRVQLAVDFGKLVKKITMGNLHKEGISIELQKELDRKAEVEADNQRLRRRLDHITGSKAWRLTRKMFPPQAHTDEDLHGK